MSLRPDPVPIALSALLDGIAADPVTDDVRVTGLTHDSADVRPGDVFVALPGRTTHGARFAAAAVAAGARAIVTDAAGAVACAGLGVPVVAVDAPRVHLGRLAARAYGHPARDLRMLAVTGTNGKTTVAAMVEAGLQNAGITAGVIGTTGVRVGGSSYASARTTPEASDLHAILARMRSDGARSVVMEVSSIAIVEHRVDGIVFDVAAFTNLSQDHLDYHLTMAEYFAAKAELFTPERARRGVVGLDDPWGRRLRETTGIPVTTWSLADPAADWHAQSAADRSGERYVVGPDGEHTSLTVALPGEFNVANAIVAFAVLRTAGVDAASAAAGIARAQVAGRMQVVDRGAVWGIVDYAHSPDAVERVLRAARGLGRRRVIAVVGAGGDRDRGKRPRIGAVAARVADVVVVTDDNPRSEDPATIRRQILAGALAVEADERAAVHEVGDRAQAITVAVGLAQDDDTVLVLGKGHEQGQEVAGVVTAFDDASTLRAALGRRAAR